MHSFINDTHDPDQGLIKLIYFDTSKAISIAFHTSSMKHSRNQNLMRHKTIFYKGILKAKPVFNKAWLQLCETKISCLKPSRLGGSYDWLPNFEVGAFSGTFGNWVSLIVYCASYFFIILSFFLKGGR